MVTDSVACRRGWYFFHVECSMPRWKRRFDVVTGTGVGDQNPKSLRHELKDDAEDSKFSCLLTMGLRVFWAFFNIIHFNIVKCILINIILYYVVYLNQLITRATKPCWAQGKACQNIQSLRSSFLSIEGQHLLTESSSFLLSLTRS